MKKCPEQVMLQNSNICFAVLFPTILVVAFSWPHRRDQLTDQVVREKYEDKSQITKLRSVLHVPKLGINHETAQTGLFLVPILNPGYIWLKGFMLVLSDQKI